MFKTNDERLDGVLSYIHTNFPDAENLMDQIMQGLGAQKTVIANAMSLGSRQDNSAAETERRNGVRTLLFLAFTEGNQPIATANQLSNKYLAMALPQIKKEVEGRLPFYDTRNPLRPTWAPGTFTMPAGAGLQNAPAAFRYLVFGMMNTPPVAGAAYTDILNNPQILRTFMLSTSVIDQAHRATYYPYGYIISAPPETIISTHTSDQAFKNYSRNNFITPLQQNDRRAELRRVSGQYPFLSPTQVLAGTNGAQGSGGYNEITVLGTAPTGQMINVVGMFMKVDSAGGRYQIPRAPATFVTAAIQTLMVATGLPIIRITDTSGATG